MPFDSENFQPTDPVLKCLQDARQWLSDPAHWAKKIGGVRPDKCAVVAVYDFSMENPGALHVGFRAVRILERQLPPGWKCVGSFNDHPTTKHADVLDLFDRAIAARLSEFLASQSQVGS